MFVEPSGSGANGILLVGEAPGAGEEREGLPFVGAAGRELDRVLARAGLQREAFRVSTVLACRPPGTKLSGASYELAAISHCTPNLDREIERMRPRVLVGLGETALRRLTGLTGISRHRGFVLETKYGIWSLNTFHPSFLLPRRGEESSSKYVGVVALDLLRAVSISAQVFGREPMHYLLDPHPSEAMSFALDYEQEL